MGPYLYEESKKAIEKFTKSPAVVSWCLTNQGTPLMLAASIGCVQSVKLLLSSDEVGDVNAQCSDKLTPLHYAASSESIHAVEVVKLLLDAGANPNLKDIAGFRPVDVIIPAPSHLELGEKLLKLLEIETDVPEYPGEEPHQLNEDFSLYGPDEFRMYVYKIRPCPCKSMHDIWDCPYVHPGDVSRRRDPMKVAYSNTPCLEFRTENKCKRGDLCPNAHGLLESGLHPDRYRTRLCKDGAICYRKLCFFAHSPTELRFLRPVSDMSSAMTLPQKSPAIEEMYLPNWLNQPHLDAGSPLLHNPYESLVSFQEEDKSVNFSNGFQQQQQIMPSVNLDFLDSYNKGHTIFGSRTQEYNSFFYWELPFQP